MKTRLYTYLNHSARIEASFFSSDGGVTEIHACVHITDNLLSYANQLDAILAATNTFLEEDNVKGSQPILKRYFVSDAANQMESLATMEKGKRFALSIVQQPPLDGSKIALWLYLQKGNTNKAYVHSWHTGKYLDEGDSEEQTRHLLQAYQDTLRQGSMSVADNCIRTWLFVQNIDENYAGVVKARNRCFDEWGLTNQTHYITSTGIEGRQASSRAYVLLDAYAVKGLKPEQIKYLYAPTHLSPTHLYGVAFERGASIEYGDRKQIYISGTASIDNKGEVVYVGDVVKQTIRMCENVDMLLKEGGAAYQDIAQAIIYLRDYSDYYLVHPIIMGKLPQTPLQFVYAPVCRPKWLIEMECIALIKNRSTSVPIL